MNECTQSFDLLQISMLKMLVALLERRDPEEIERVIPSLRKLIDELEGETVVSNLQ